MDRPSARANDEGMASSGHRSGSNRWLGNCPAPERLPEHATATTDNSHAVGGGRHCRVRGMRQLRGAHQHEVDRAIVDNVFADDALDVVRALDDGGSDHNPCATGRDDASADGFDHGTGGGGRGTCGLGVSERDLCQLERQHRVQPVRKPDGRPRRGDSPVQRRHLQHEPAPVRHLLRARWGRPMDVVRFVVGRV